VSDRPARHAEIGGESAGGGKPDSRGQAASPDRIPQHRLQAAAQIAAVEIDVQVRA